MRRLFTTTVLTTALATSAVADGSGQPGPMLPSLQIGGAVVVTPKYEGSSSYRVLGLPIIAPARNLDDDSSRLDFKGIDDIRFRLVRIENFEAGPLAGWRFGRDEDDGSRLRGLGDVDGGLVAGGYAAYRIGFLKPFLSYHHQLTGDTTGGLLRFGTEALFTLDRGVRLTATLGATYADSDYMDQYFSISAAQAARSVAGLPTFAAGAGIKDVGFGLAAAVPLSELWTLRLGAKYTRLVGDAADSPVVETADQFSGTVGLSYRIDWGR